VRSGRYADAVRRDLGLRLIDGHSLSTVQPVHRTTAEIPCPLIEAWTFGITRGTRWRSTPRRADPCRPSGPHGLARRLGIRIRYDCRGCWVAPRTQSTTARSSSSFGAGFSPLVEGVKIFHELAERHLKHERGSEGHEEACDQLAYALRMPRPAFRDLIRVVGRDFEQLAAPWPASQTAGALRYLEVTGTPASS
jgi:hypothetical protein